MKSKRILFGAFLLGAVLALGAAPGMQASVAVSISFFHDQLTPYGSWVVSGSYGNVWVPRVAAGWSPYVEGEWVYTDYGWTWVSYDPWGDVPCHYGSWAWTGPYGWVWVPGTVWAPAWVTWAYTDDYIGWAPVPPSFAFTVNGYVGAPVVVEQSRYVFVPTRQFVGVRVASVRVAPERNTVIFPQAVKATEYRVSGGIVRTAGPPASRIERVTAKRIAPVSIDRVNLKARPTTIAQAGVVKASRIPVAAPPSENKRAIAGAKTQPTQERAQPETQAKSRTTEKGTTKSTTARSESSKHAPAPESARGTRPEPPAEPKSAKKSEESKKSVSHAPSSAPEHPSAEARKSAPKAEEKPVASHKKEKAPQAKPQPPAQAEQQAHRPAQEKPPEPREETRVAHGGKPSSPAPQAHRPAPKPKPPEKKANPPSEEKPQ